MFPKIEPPLHVNHIVKLRTLPSRAQSWVDKLQDPLLVSKSKIGQINVTRNNK